MSSNYLRRLLKDLKRLRDDPPEGISGALREEDNIMLWDASISGYIY
jgi:ubiquitin-protein ligase